VESKQTTRMEVFRGGSNYIILGRELEAEFFLRLPLCNKCLFLHFPSLCMSFKAEKSSEGDTAHDETIVSKTLEDGQQLEVPASGARATEAPEL